MKVFSWDFKNNLNINEDLILIMGSFESIHLGHYELIKLAKSIKQQRNCKIAMMLMQSPIKKGEVASLKAFQPKVRLYTLDKLGIDYAFAVEPNQEIINLDYKKVIENLKLNNVKYIVCGEDFKFGFNRLGTIEKLRKHFDVNVASAKKVSGVKISSSLINEFILEGNISAANELLIDNYAFITNIEQFYFNQPKHLTKLKNGVYIVNVIIANFEYHGLVKIDNNVESEEIRKSVMYLFDLEFIPSKYQEIYIEFIAKIRQINNESENNLTEKDIQIAKKYFVDLLNKEK
ncbi:riboflavin biosynthesis protein [[Mycoplasma] falconis]|uniref:FAD synthase n=1 Tax=[Mycoplasma] falconis TaxID=92403 RepID=A0A501X9W9_9BACT|nr:riboflavin biosynthesis protein [[Mycoplasma] falconis]TPE57345.1 riboflavin biosynthesis protein [[Mycoplasma] falconis]